MEPGRSKNPGILLSMELSMRKNRQLGPNGPKPKGSAGKSSFTPDTIAVAVSSAIDRDFCCPLVYGDEVLQLALSRQKKELLKKYCSSSYDGDDLESIAFKKFLKTNERMGLVNEHLVRDLPKPYHKIQSSSSFMDKVHLRARALVCSVLGCMDEEEWYLACRHSTGSSIGVPFSDTSVESKFTYPISSTLGVSHLLMEYFLFDYQMKRSVIELNEQNLLVEKFHIVDGSRATTVEKSDTARRMICVEPTANMFFQQGLMHMIYDRMAVFGLDVRSLPNEHVYRAYLSSITSKEATIDWSSASDSVSMELIRWLLPPDWLQVVELTRSPRTLIDGVWVDLHMFATMGNALTFALETLVFWSYGHAYRLTLNSGNSLFPEWEDLKSISVFGDDCIVPTDIAPGYINLLVDLGFVPNMDKTYLDSKGFRESCGGDFFHGRDVRPFNLRSPRSGKKSNLEPWLYVQMNSLLKKYRSYFGELKYIYYHELWDYYQTLFNENHLLVKVVPHWFPDDSGFKISDDLERFRACYSGFRFSTITCNNHGTKSFYFLRFQYRLEGSICSSVRYALWLKRPRTSEYNPYHSRYIRRIGGYVVARGSSSFWSW